MTIGIAAFGDHAGLAVVEGLKAAEAIGRGALHGFVSLVAIGPDGSLYRAEVQGGGADSLLAGQPLPKTFADAPLAGLMSSGPNRPTPLSQFTPADPSVGLVTGHRFPNARGSHDRPLNLEVLDLMRKGFEPREAVAQIVADNPLVDAGFIALSRDRRLHAANTRYLLGFGDAGRGGGRLRDGEAGVEVLHNAIRPHGSLAALVVEISLSVMGSSQAPDSIVAFRTGVPILIGDHNAINIDDNGRVVAIVTYDIRYARNSWNFGLGYQTRVYQRNVLFGRALYEPLLCAEDGKIASIDGGSTIDLPIGLTSVSGRVPTP
jgi:hypothetical protein